MKIPMILLPILLIIAIGFTGPLMSSKYSNVRSVDKTSYSPNRIIKSTYNIEYNLYSVLYIEYGDTVGLDDIYPIELDSLINELNTNNK